MCWSSLKALSRVDECVIIFFIQLSSRSVTWTGLDFWFHPVVQYKKPVWWNLMQLDCIGEFCASFFFLPSFPLPTPRPINCSSHHTVSHPSWTESDYWTSCKWPLLACCCSPVEEKHLESFQTPNMQKSHVNSSSKWWGFNLSHIAWTEGSGAPRNRPLLDS
jgi:hypothetical protein